MLTKWSCTKLFVLFLVVFLSFTVQSSSAQISGYDVTIEQLHLLNYATPTYYSTIAMITLGYTPDVLDYYVNIITPDKQQQPQWIVRNLYLPDASWIDLPQMISVRFDMQMLGVVPGEDVPALNIAIFTTENVLDQMPDAQQFAQVQVDTLTEDAQGEGTEIPLDVPPIEAFPPFPEFAPFDTVTAVEFRGCRVPNAEVDDSAHPDSPTYAGDFNACAPVAAANSLKWLSDTYAEINIPDNLRAILEELSNLMKRQRNGPTTIQNFIQGKLDYIQKSGLPIYVKFQSKFLSGKVSSSDGKTWARNDNTGSYPTWTWLKKQMDDGEDVEMMYHWWDGEQWRGHAVVLTGAEESAAGRKKIKFKHDARQRSAGGTKQEDEDIYIDSHGRMILRSRNAFVGSAVAESPGDPLPVELGLFTFAVVKGDVKLMWNTFTESNNYGFDLLRDGKKISFIKGHGTSVVPHSYVYIDSPRESGRITYQLYQIDFDGQRNKVGNLIVNVGTLPVEFALLQNYPNPFNPNTTIRYALPEEGLATLAIYNLLGEKVAVLVNEKQQAGAHNVEFNAGGLASGVYVYRLEMNGMSRQKKFILLK